MFTKKLKKFPSVPPPPPPPVWKLGMIKENCNSDIRLCKRGLFLSRSVIEIIKILKMIFLRILENQHAVDVKNDVDERKSVLDLKKFIAEKEGISEQDQLFYYGGNILEDNQDISSCLPDDATIDVSIRLVGGKVHGSLARAGKVKGQTPKVEKQEKKKKKTGRAKRRMQFNRRFVNVVVTFGRKKGPNSNS
ncbi:40S ribosomal protein S30 [Caerostris darwini]|uniref:40S ribosomal protein S30 n=1 Tax=Caerostris darwini TaxID=1538125 RepID=A0AAV4UL70_9ARAC|nr:40S ribosomal protein S30 [Caerostris darwini]